MSTKMFGEAGRNDIQGEAETNVVCCCCFVCLFSASNDVLLSVTMCGCREDKRARLHLEVHSARIRGSRQRL